MDSWTLQGDSYSFLRSAPRTFSLCHREGTPNHVEIFDIINVPTQRSAISETTCLCDIFGDDCESPSLSSSPAAAAFVPPRRELEATAAASPLVDDLNDSGSYHTAPGSSEGEEGFEDSRERLYSPPLQSPSSGGEGLSSEHPDNSEDTSPNLEQKSKSPVPQLSTSNPPPEPPFTCERTSSSGHSSSCIITLESRVSPSSPSADEIRHSPFSPCPNQSLFEAEQEKITAVSRGKHNSPSYQFLNSSPCSELRNPSLALSVNTQSSPDLRAAQNSPDPRSQHISPLPDFPTGFTEPDFERRANLPSPLPSSCSSRSPSREASVTPELKNRPYSPDTPASSPFHELRGRVSLPDLLSRGSTPDIEDPHDSPESISNPPVRRNSTATPESQSVRLSVEAGSSVSTPAPRYTPPSPVISVTTSPVLLETSVSPDFRQTAPSPGSLSVTSLATTGSRTPSPGLSNRKRNTWTPSENRSQVSSPGVGYTLSTSPEHRGTAPSPEIRITASSPELHTVSAASRSLNSSPHITGICYSIIQPEDRNSPAFPELAHLSNPGPHRTLVSPEVRSYSQSSGSVQSSIVEPTGTPRNSPYTSGFTSSVLQPEVSLSHQQGYQTPSPQSRNQSPSPEQGYQTPSSQKHKIPSPQHLPSRDRSPVSPFHKQSSSVTLSTEDHLQHTQLTPPQRITPEVERQTTPQDCTEIQYPIYLTKDNVSPSFELDKGDTSPLPEIKSSSPVVIVSSPEFTSPILAEEKIEGSLACHSREIEARAKEVNGQDNVISVCFPEEKQDISPSLFQTEDHNNPLTEIKSLPPHGIVFKEKHSAIPAVRRAASISPVQRLKDTQPPFASRSPISESSSFIKSFCTPQLSRRHLATKVSREKGERFTENMAHHVHRRRTPSPPLTRFTPVHIIAPEKPYRQWQNRSRSPSASSPSGNLNKVVTNRESPNVAPADNNSQAYCGRLVGQLEMDREMQLEEERVVVGERKGEREIDRERKREEQAHEKGEGWQGDASYGGEQVELSFNARNRKGPVGRSAAPTSRETRLGLPTVHSCSESLLSTRQLQQQQSLPRLSSQQDPRGGGLSRRLQSPAHQNKNSGRVASNRPCRSSSSSMGSEMDEADDEVKWFTDLAFHSLSSPEVDYLDMYNSSHRSSTNVSQPSTQESPAGVTPAWQAYADFRGSASKLDNDELSFHQSSAYYPDGLDPLRRYEMGSFECVDVAVEREDTRKVRRGVPKRQIQLKRKNDGKQDASSENSSPGIPLMMESPSHEGHSRETLVRQHSTPAATQDRYPSESSPQIDKKLKLQKSASLDETCSKTKMATCLIKSVLLKKMQSVDKDTDDQAEDVNPAYDEKSSPPTESTVLKVSPNPDTHNLESSSPLSDYGLSPECLPVEEGELSTKDVTKSPKSFGVRSSNRPSSSSSSKSVNVSQTDSEETDSQSRNATALKSEMRSELKVPFDSKQSRAEERRADGIKIWDEKDGGDSANDAAGNTGGAAVTGAGSRQAGMTNRDQECENTQDHKHLPHGEEGACTSKPQQIILKGVEKKKASLNVRLTPEAENKTPSPDLTYRGSEAKRETSVHEKMEDDRNGKVKAPIHKVRDMRQLVKNTYNLSFKAPVTVMPLDVTDGKTNYFDEERREEVKEEREREAMSGMEQQVSQEMRRKEPEMEPRVETEEEKKEEEKDSQPLTFPPPLQSKPKPLPRPQPIQIEYKAVCWKEDKNKMSCGKKENPGDKLLASTECITEVSRESQENYTTDKPCQHDLKKAAGAQEVVTEMHKMPDKEVERVVITDKKPPMLGSLPKRPCKEREVSTAVVLIRDGSSQTKSSASPAQEEIPPSVQVPAPPLSPGLSTPGSTGHSVSMLLKEKGYHADIGAVVGGDTHNAPGGKGLPHKHVNCLEIPLQTTATSDRGQGESHRERTFSSSSITSGRSSVSENMDAPTKTTEVEVVNSKPPMKDVAKPRSAPALPPQRSMQEQTLPKPKDLDFEAVKRIDPTFPPRSPAIRRFKPQPIEVKSLSKETQKQEMPANATVNNRPQTIEVKSIAKNSQKPIVPPKPSCKFKPADIGAPPSDAQRLSATTSAVRPHGEERSQTIVVSSPTIYRKISNDSTATSNYTRKVAVSSVSSLKPPPSKMTTTTTQNLSNQVAAPPEMEACNDSGQQQQQPAASSQTSRYTQRPITLAQTSDTCPGLTSAPGPMSEPVPSQVPDSASAGANRPSQPAVADPENKAVHPRMGLACPRDQAMPVTLNNAKQPTAVHTTQMPGYTRQPYRRSLSGEHPHRTDDLQFYASDDPPSYDERESFSPLMLPDLNSRRLHRYQPSSRPPPCSCTATCPSHPGLTAPHHHRSPHNLTPPHSPGHAMPYQATQPPLRPHQCRPEPQPMSYRPNSPKSSSLGPSQPPAMFQPLHQPPPCPPHPSLMQACAADRPLQPPQHMDPRRAPVHRSPQQQPPGMAGAPYSDTGHSHSPGLPPIDPQYLCGPQSLGPSYGSEYGGDTSSLYSESNYGQAPRRVLLDPETGKYFYIEVPVQPLRKMLFDPETGQYVEVLIPQQAMSHSGLYPPSAAPYPSLHNPNIYAPAPQYMPYAAPPPPAHAQTQPQPPRYPEASAESTMHPSGPGVSYRNHSGQRPKPEPPNHPPMDQSYLESMYYVPTGMNASPNPTPPDYYHKHPPNLPPTGGKRS